MKRASAGCVIAIDFDGTVVTHKVYPEVGEPVGAEHWLKLYTGMGAKLILYTCRSSVGLTHAHRWFVERGIPIWAINENPTDADWFEDEPGPKPYADLYVDDKTVGIPLIQPMHPTNKPYVDWAIVGPQIERFVERRLKENI